MYAYIFMYNIYIYIYTYIHIYIYTSICMFVGNCYVIVKLKLCDCKSKTCDDCVQM